MEASAGLSLSLARSGLKSLSVLLFPLQRRFQEKGGKGNEGRKEDLGSTQQRPVEPIPAKDEEEEKDTKDPSVDHSGETDRFLMTEDPFFID